MVQLLYIVSAILLDSGVVFRNLHLMVIRAKSAKGSYRSEPGGGCQR